MFTLNPLVDEFLADGCGRCKYHATPQCKVKKWMLELETLRQIALESGLKEDRKWGFPVYTLEGKNIIMLGAFKDFCTMSFFKGVLLKDSKKILVQHGENSQSARIAKFTNEAGIQQVAATLQLYIQEAIELEKKGEKVVFEKQAEPIPEELVVQFEKMPALKTAFYALTPGRQRGYILHFSQPKQSATRLSRIEKCMDKIMKGEGMHDEYKKQS